jgi:hypothetical protein
MGEVIGLTEISEASSIAWEVYDHGWIQERSPSTLLISKQLASGRCYYQSDDY